MGSSRDHTLKTFQCASMHIHLFRGSLLKTKQFPNILIGNHCSTLSKQNEKLGTPSSRIGAMVMRISKANSLWVFTDTPLENCTQVNIHMKTQHLESLIIESTCCHKPLLKSSELLLLLLRHDDKPIGIPRSVWRWSG
jgi:hypothetical protein